MDMRVHSKNNGLEIREELGADNKGDGRFFVYAVGSTTCLAGPISLGEAEAWITDELLDRAARAVAELPPTPAPAPAPAPAP